MKNDRTKRQQEDLAAIRTMADDEVDTSDIPESLDWAGAEVGKFYRPIKKPVTVRLDVDVLAWLKSTGTGYQTRINSLLRGAMNQERRGDRR